MLQMFTHSYIALRECLGGGTPILKDRVLSVFSLERSRAGAFAITFRVGDTVLF